jgi:two-component system nitrogen regulation sensor histidine kinase NtrY
MANGFSNSDSTPERKDSRVRRYVLGSIIFLTLALAATHTFFHHTSVGSHRFVRMTFLVYAGTFLAVLALLILATILGRNLIKLYFEKKSGRPGSGFKTKLVRAFIVLSLLPALLLFVFAYALINESMERWFLAPPAQIQESSRALVQQYYADTEKRAKYYAGIIAGQLETELSAVLRAPEDFPVSDIEDKLREFCRAYALNTVQIFDAQGRPVAESGPTISSPHHQDFRTAMIAEALQGDRQFRFDSVAPKDPGDEICYAAAPVLDAGGRVAGVVLTEIMRSSSLKYWADRVTDAADKYDQIQTERNILRLNMLMMLALATLLVIFAFAWFALYLSKRITVPVQALVEGAAAVSEGNLTHRVDCPAFDELGSLVTSFNMMTADLEDNEKRIAAARETLQRSSEENAARRLYIETILQTIATGVIAFDAGGGVQAMNRAAMKMLRAREIVNREEPAPKIDDIVDPAAREVMRALINRTAVPGYAARNVEIAFPEKTARLAATATPLTDSENRQTGFVLVLEDMTELHQMERAAAWREVAQRLAHEFKNPLTPIRLSAERVLNRYQKIAEPAPANLTTPQLKEFARFGQLLADCVQTIIQEADSLKNLVDEFTRFARLPETRPEDADIRAIVENVLQLYDGRVSDIRILKEFDADMPRLRLDTEQMKRVFINLFDNAIEAMSQNTGSRTLRIHTFPDRIQGTARIEISDNGRGFYEENHDNLFLPYFSTRKGGTGLGLAIVRQIITDHHGSIYAEANTPAGVRIVIDLPLIY